MSDRVSGGIKNTSAGVGVTKINKVIKSSAGEGKSSAGVCHSATNRVKSPAGVGTWHAEMSCPLISSL